MLFIYLSNLARTILTNIILKTFIKIITSLDYLIIALSISRYIRSNIKTIINYSP